jgi:hypothetical protein
MKFSLDHPYKYDWKITCEPLDISYLSDLIKACKVKGLANVTNLLQSQQVLGIVIVNKNSQPATLFQHFPILTVLNCDSNLLVTVSQTWEEEAYFVPKSMIDDVGWSRLTLIGKISLPLPSRVTYTSTLQC